MSRKAIPDCLRADFREEARRIVADDRAARALGASQDTIGRITRAMAKAYVRGRAVDANTAELTDGDLPRWEDLPPRARDALAMIGFAAVRDGSNSLALRESDDFDTSGRRRWCAVAFGPSLTYTDGTARKLVALGLLEQDPDDPRLLNITPAGIDTYRRYRARSDAGDPTLPRISLRAG